MDGELTIAAKKQTTSSATVDINEYRNHSPETSLMFGISATCNAICTFGLMGPDQSRSVVMLLKFKFRVRVRVYM